jgi:hypothetical protein
MGPKVRRMIVKYRRNSDRRDSVVDVTHVPFEEICKVVPPASADPLLYDCYELDAAQLGILKNVPGEIVDTAQWAYYLEAESD